MQVAALGDLAYSFKGYDYRHLSSLAEYLSTYYSPDYEVMAYEAPHYAISEAEVKRIQISELGQGTTRGISTLFIPQAAAAPIHLEIVKKYHLDYLLDDIRLVPLNSPAATQMSIACSKRFE